jgi:hypothetical protein
VPLLGEQEDDAGTSDPGGRRLRRADEFYGPGSGKNDIWIVRFEKLLPNDVAVESPSSIILEVDDQTRETSQFDTL